MYGTLIQTQTLASTASTVTFSAIPQTYTDLVIVASARTAYAGSGDTIVCQFNGDATSANYTYRRLIGNSTTASSATGNYFFVGYCAASTDTASTFGSAQLVIPNYSATGTKVGSAESVYENNAALAIQGIHANSWSGTAAITSVALSAPSATAFQIGSTFSIYGLTHF
jgi:hypothetical protein